MKMHGHAIEFKVSGPRALFSDPVTRIGGQKCSYPVPTYEALKGIVKNVFWKPTIIWHIEKVRVMNPISMSTRGVRPIHYQNGQNERAYYTYLENVEYHVRASFDWNRNRPDRAGDWDDAKYRAQIRDHLEMGGRRPAFFGTSDCGALIEPCEFDAGEGYYDHSGEKRFGVMLHGITYADEAYSDETRGMMTVRMWEPVMVDGVIEFIRPEDCTMTRPVRPMGVKAFPKPVVMPEKEVEG